jgi:hypothetical protein
MGFRFPPGTPPWLPSLVFLTLFFTAGIVWSLKFGPKLRTATGWPQDPMSSGLVGYLHFKSATRWLVVWCGFVLVMIATQMGVLGLPFSGVGLAIMLVGYLRPKGAVQTCYVDENGAITLIRGDVAIPFDLNHFQYIRMYTAKSRYSSRYQSMLVLYQDTEPTGSTWLSSVFLPRVDGDRVVLFYNRWRDANNAIIAPSMMDDLFYQACVRAGRPPEARGGGLFFGSPGWDLRPQWSPR